MVLEKRYIKKVDPLHRKKYAQFFTPEPIARFMVEWIMGKENLQTVLEPAFGLGIFSRILLEKEPNVKIKGFDVDPLIFSEAKSHFSCALTELLLEDYLFNDWNSRYDAIICNPPYFKFHDYKNKESLTQIKDRLNIDLSGFTNIYTLFLLKSVHQLKEGGRAAYIVPSEFLNSNYGESVKKYLLESNTLRAVYIFDFKEKLFDTAMTTSAILLLAKDKNYDHIDFREIKKLHQLDKIRPFIDSYPLFEHKRLFNKKEIRHDVKWRRYYQKDGACKYKNLIPFKEVAKVVRGIATGANDYFVFNRSKARQHSIERKYLLPCIAKSKDVKSVIFTKRDFEELETKDARIFLLNAKNIDSDKNLSKYIELGISKEIDKRYLTSRRKPWYKQESREPAPIWVGVFNRKGLKFIRNEARIRNLTTFHCIYPRNDLMNKIDIDLLFAYLLSDTAKEIFNDNSREYADGLKKFEPNDLNEAYMLDLSLLDTREKECILEYYSQYKMRVENKNDGTDLIESIDKILKKRFEI